MEGIEGSQDIGRSTCPCPQAGYQASFHKAGSAKVLENEAGLRDRSRIEISTRMDERFFHSAQTRKKSDLVDQ